MSCSTSTATSASSSSSSSSSSCSSKFHIRFAPTFKPARSTTSTFAATNCPTWSSPSTPERSGRTACKSHSGCLECKRRRVKCDEAYPVCMRCRRRGSVCLAAPRVHKWQMEQPRFLHSKKMNPNKRLLQYWCEKGSHIMSLKPDNNPMSFAVLVHLADSCALLHVLQSAGAAHERFFRPSTVCLEEQSKALLLVRQEITRVQDRPVTSFLSVYMLGLLSGWLSDEPADFGKQHLQGARAILDVIIAKGTVPVQDEFSDFILDAFIFWDMNTAFLVDPEEQKPLNTPEMYAAVREASGRYHAVTGNSLEMCYLLGILNRYCRRVVDTGCRDMMLESAFEDELSQAESMGDDADLTALDAAYIAYGFINLYRICGDRPYTADSLVAESKLSLLGPEERNAIIRMHALHALQNLLETPASSNYINNHAGPLLSAASELTSKDGEERDRVRDRFKAMYSLNRLPANMKALELLEELWVRRDEGQMISWLDLMLAKGWRLMLG